MPRRDTVPLRDYTDRGLAGIQAEIDRRLSEVQRETEGRFREQAAAVLAATAALERRLDGMNEFRESIRDITAAKVDTALFRQTISELMSRLERTESALERQRGRMGAYVAVGTIMMVAVAILTLIINHIRL